MWENESSLKRKLAKNSCNLHLHSFEDWDASACSSSQPYAPGEARKARRQLILIRIVMSEADTVTQLMSVWPRRPRYVWTSSDSPCNAQLAHTALVNLLELTCQLWRRLGLVKMATLSAKTQMRSWACTRCPSDVQTSCKHLLTTHMAHSTQARPRNHLKAIKMCEETLTNTVIPNCVANLSMRASQSYIINPIYIYV